MIHDKPDGRWVTIHGTHVFIKAGESLDDAIARLSDGPDNPNYIRIQKRDSYGHTWGKIIREDDLEDYELTGWYKHHDQPDVQEAIDFVDRIDIEGRSVDNIMAELDTEYKFSYMRDFLVGRLEERIAEYQEKKATEFLKRCEKLTSPQMPESAAMETNPHHNESAELLHSGSHERAAADYTMNCQRCVQAFVLRWCHGYDVQAMPCDKVWSEKQGKFVKGSLDEKLTWYTQKNGYRLLHNGTNSYYNNWQCVIFNAADVRKTHVDSIDIQNEIGYSGTEDQYRWIKRTVKEAGPGACYIAAVCWKGSRDDKTGSYDAHVFCIVNDAGKVKCIDPQTGKECSEYFNKKQIKSNRTELFRADTCRLNGSIMEEVIKW